MHVFWGCRHVNFCHFFRHLNLAIFGPYVLRSVHDKGKAYSWGHSVLQTHFLV